MKVSIIVAASTNNVIGRDGELPWRLSTDLKRFKSITTGKPLIMGRLTHLSIGKPLPGRQNIVLSTDRSYQTAGCEVAESPQGALELAGAADEVMIIGGGHVYRLFLPMADTIYLTRVHATPEGDAHFPELDPGHWQLVSCEDHPAGENDQYPFSFERLKRISN
jgi:dihydrofolate reductase